VSEPASRSVHVRAARASAVTLSLVVLALSCAKGSERRSPPGAGAPGLSASTQARASATPASSAPVGTGAAGRRREPLNVILLTIDSLRADVPWLGYDRPIAPHLTALARESVVYERAYSASSTTAKSVATILSGRFASTLYRDRRFFTRYAPSNRFLAEILGERNVRSFSWHGHLYFGRESGFEQGFQEWRLVPGIKFDPETDNEVTSDKMTALGREILEVKANTSGQFFAWAHYMDPHDQYLRHAGAPEFGKKARDRYDSEVWFTDHHIGKLLEWARTQPWWSKTAVIVTADHGEAFGEHEMYKHAFELWEVLVRVPMLVYAPGVKARAISERRSHVDLAPTILELMGVTPPTAFQGRSVVPELFGAPAEPREPILCELAEDTHNPPRRAAIQGKLKLIEFERGRTALYDLSRDPGERTNLDKALPAEHAAMKRTLATAFAAIGSFPPYGGGKLREGGRADGPQGPP
jgi:choline-sulfatase